MVEIKEEVEIWKSLVCIGYPDYEISTLGNVKSLNYRCSGKEKILKPFLRGGYYAIHLSKNGKQKNFYIHKLVALTFLKNDNNLPCINHKDENKENNHVDNLEVCSYSYNVNYGSRNERVSEKLKGKKHTEESKQRISIANKGKKRSEEQKQRISETRKGKGTKPIIQYTKDMVFVREFDSATTVNIELNIDSSSIIKCCKRKLKSSGGFIWRYK